MQQAVAEPEQVIPTAGHEPKDVSGRFILGAVIVVVGSLACVIVGVMWAFPGSLQGKTMPRDAPRFPQPELQASPRDDMGRFRAEQLQALNSAGWIDRERGVAHIPIDAAMHLLARDGIPGWPTPR